MTGRVRYIFAPAQGRKKKSRSSPSIDGKLTGWAGFSPALEPVEGWRFVADATIDLKKAARTGQGQEHDAAE